MSNSISGQAAAGALITLSGAASAITYANLTGAYSFTGLGAGSYVITPSKTGLVFSPASQNATIVATNITGVNFLMSSAFAAGNNYTLQTVTDRVRSLGDIEPTFEIGGWTSEPMLSIGTDVMAAICAVSFPHKWNEIKLPQFYTNSWQQDYALVNPDGSSVYNVEWLERGTAIGINENLPGMKPFARIECGRALSQKTGANSVSNSLLNDPAFIICSYQNSDLYYGVWGQPNVASATLGNNPQSGSVYTNPIGNYSQPNNPIAQIIDANGNLLVLTTYGTEGTTAPLAAPAAPAGTTAAGSGATTVWTVVDPVGLGIRIVDVPSQTGFQWQMNVTGQMPPVVFTTIGQSLEPLPDKYEPYFRAGVIAQLYRYSSLKATRDKFKDEWQLWLKSLNELKSLQDRELEEYRFVPDRSIMGSGQRRNTYQGGAWPFSYPRP
jgi:hypothetical protein